MGRLDPGRRRMVTVIAAVAGGTLVLVLGGIVFSSHGRCAGAGLASAGRLPSGYHAESHPPIGETAVGRLRAALGGTRGQVAYCDDFADPYVMRIGSAYFAYSTNSGNENVPVLATHDLFSRGGRRDALPTLGRWAQRIGGRVWAPAVLNTGGSYVLYYVAARNASTQCIGMATAKDALGPFRDTETRPFVCPPRGAIDPSPFTADGRRFLLWKDVATGSIVSQPLRADGRALLGRPVAILRPTQRWEAGVVEGPSMVDVNGHDVLFYSGGDWRTASYATGYASCASPLGPCTKPAGTRPWLASTVPPKGPGGPSVFTDTHGRTWLALHAWAGETTGYPHGARALYVLRLVFVGSRPIAT